VWRGLSRGLARHGKGFCGVLLGLKRALGQEPEYLFQGQFRLGRAEVQPEQAPLAGPGPVDGRPAAPPGRCHRGGNARLLDSPLLDSAHLKSDGWCILTEPAGLSETRSSRELRLTEDHIISVPSASGLHHGGMFVERVGNDSACISHVFEPKPSR
jgi:hypothetical protein